jgi:hypothetical protein
VFQQRVSATCFSNVFQQCVSAGLGWPDQVAVDGGRPATARPAKMEVKATKGQVFFVAVCAFTGALMSTIFNATHPTNDKVQVPMYTLFCAGVGALGCIASIGPCPCVVVMIGSTAAMMVYGR